MCDLYCAVLAARHVVVFATLGPAGTYLARVVVRGGESEVVRTTRFTMAR
jgi:hypothetical protein